VAAIRAIRGVRNGEEKGEGKEERMCTRKAGRKTCGVVDRRSVVVVYVWL